MPKVLTCGTHRSVAIEATLARVEPLLKTIGVTRIADITGLDRIGLPVVMAVRPGSRGLSVAQGKGISLAAAQVSAAMEALESYHAENTTLQLVLGSYAELNHGRRIVDPARLVQHVGISYSPDERTLWVEGVDLLSGIATLVPFDCVHADFTTYSLVGSRSFPVNTNGLASGNHSLEAICHAICEVIERDALTLWEASGDAARQLTQVDPATVTDSACRNVLDALDRADISYAIWNVTSDIAVPAFFCRIWDRQQGSSLSSSVAGGSGCHLDPAIALFRSISEAVQSRLTAIAGSRDDLSFTLYRSLANLRDDIGGDARTPTASFSGISSATATFKEDLVVLKNRVLAADLDSIIVVDLSRDELGIAVVRVIIPGLECATISDQYTTGRRLASRRST